jgi:GxxExxY protein
MEKDPRTHAIIGAAIEVHRELGPGFLEPVYHEALAAEFAQRGIPFRRELDVPVQYKGRSLQCTYRPDFICHGCIIVELKTCAGLGVMEQAQMINYLRAGRFELGLLLNFGAPRLEYKRVILSTNHLRPEGRDQKSDVGNQRSEVGSQHQSSSKAI